MYCWRIACDSVSVGTVEVVLLLDAAVTEEERGGVVEEGDGSDAANSSDDGLGGGCTRWEERLELDEPGTWSDVPGCREARFGEGVRASLREMSALLVLSSSEGNPS